MKIIDSDQDYIRRLIENDIRQAASEVSFFHEMKIEPKDFIDQMTAIAKMFGLDFWGIIDRDCSDFEKRRLHALYEGTPLNKTGMNRAHSGIKEEVGSDC